MRVPSNIPESDRSGSGGQGGRGRGREALGVAGSVALLVEAEAEAAVPALEPTSGPEPIEPAVIVGA